MASLGQLGEGLLDQAVFEAVKADDRHSRAPIQPASFVDIPGTFKNLLKQ